MDEFRDAIARITIEGTKVRGTGFLVARDLIATALHVVADRKTEPPTFIPGAIHLAFPGHETDAEVLVGKWNRDADCVLLRCLKPFECRPIPLRELKQSDDIWKTHGFPDAQPIDGMTMEGEVRAYATQLTNFYPTGQSPYNPVIQLFCKDCAAGNGAPVPGLSGAPVIIGGAAVGLMRFALMQQKGQTVAGALYACNAQDIANLWPEQVPKPLLTRPPPRSGHPAPVPADISRIVKYAPADLIGRAVETKLLNEAWDKAVRGEPRPRVLTFVALGGEGKTSLVAKWAVDLAYQNWPGCDAVFAWSFYSQGAREEVQSSSDVFLKKALTFFGDPATAGGAQGPFEKGQRLARLAGERRALLILDGLEPLQYATGPPMDGKLKDDGIKALLDGLAVNNLGLCVVTTRYSIPDLRAFSEKTATEVNLLRLSKEAGVALLRSLEVNGTQPEFETLVEDVKGHALTLNLLGSYLRDAYAGDIRRRDQVKLEEADEEQGGHAFRVMDAYVRWFESGEKNGKRALAVSRLMGLFDRPADTGCLKALWRAPAIPDLTEPLVGMGEAQRNIALKRLEDAKLLTVNRDAARNLLALDAHPLLREYFAKALREQHPEAWRAAHRRLYEHLCTRAKDKPDTLEELQPLYQAVSHGCQAGMYKEAFDGVYRGRILRGFEYYSSRKCGAFVSDLGAVTCFFEQPWSRVVRDLLEWDQALLVANASWILRALGRLTQCVEPMRTSVEMFANQDDFAMAARAATTLSHTELMLGEVDLALTTAEQAIFYANNITEGDERIDEIVERIEVRADHADTLHQAGHPDKAKALFREAEEMQAMDQPEHPLLSLMLGFQYCDLLLAVAERAAWRRMLNLPSLLQPSSLLESCQAVSERAGQTLHWDEPTKRYLEIALDHLTLGRTALYAAILEGKPIDQFDLCREFLQRAVNGLRRAGTQHHLPRGLLTRAWLRFRTGARSGPESAQSDLNEAFEIAGRGPMPLFMADIHLHRARLFGLSKDRPASFPWTSQQDDLARARQLIEKHGYWRRKEELEDAESAARQ